MEAKTTQQLVKDTNYRARLLGGLSQVLLHEGFRKLTPARILMAAGESPNSNKIRQLFGSLDRLMMAFIKESPGWYQLNQILTLPASNTEAPNKQTLQSRLKQLYHAYYQFFMASAEMRELLYFGLTKPRNKLKILFTIAREEALTPLLSQVDQLYGHQAPSIKAQIGSILGASHIIVYHTYYNGSPFCGLDIRNPTDYAVLMGGAEWLMIEGDYVSLRHEEFAGR
ncbi:hypothetical protein SAMN05216436_101345 [bacterium A37T11]|nr:hypothetical protein SAMN05216436_101345 [bacterium A37T11]